MNKLLLFTLSAGWMCALNSALAQYNPQFSRLITVTENAGNNETDFQARLVIDTQTEVLAGNMQSDGADIRFMTSNACDSLNAYPHWIESGMNTSTTVIWVKLPTLMANTTDSIYLYYGAGNVANQSNFSATFPNAIVSGGSNVTLTGAQNVGWLQIDAGDILYITGGSLLDIQARNVIIDGSVDGVGAGYVSPGVGVSTGNGPGGGVGGTSSGAGGGSYGGVGGSGGYDSGDPINPGGAVYGTNNGFDIDMGSTGGSVSSVAAGSGGGALVLTAEYIAITGNINVNGAEAQQPGGGQGAGGGAGGGVLIYGDNIDFTGIISSNGGGGSIGTSTANDDGGGGAGGRIKLFYGSTLNATGTYSVNGGAGGPNGTAGGGQVGGVGTTYEGMLAFSPASYIYGPITAISANPVPLVANLSDVTDTCSATPVSPEATDLCGAIITGVPDVSFPITAVGTTVVTWTYTDGGGASSTQTQNVIISGLDVSVTLSSWTLTAGATGVQYQWIDCDNNNAPIAGEMNNSFSPSMSGNYAVIITSGTCSDTSACTLVSIQGLDELTTERINVYPNPSTDGYFTIDAPSHIQQCELFDVFGRKISVQTEVENGTVDASGLTHGRYLLRIVTDQSVQTKEVVILH